MAKKRLTIPEKVFHLLETVPHQELKAFVRETAGNDKAFRNHLFTYFAGYNQTETVATYKKQVKAILRAAGGRGKYYFIRRGATRKIAKEIDKLLDSAGRQIANKNFKSAIFICIAIAEEVTISLNSADDSYGNLTSLISNAFSLLEQITREDISEKTRQYLLKYCNTAFTSQNFTHWDYHIDLLSLMKILVQTDDEVHHLLTLLDSDSDSKYHRRQMQLIKYQVLLDKKDKDDALQFLFSHIKNPILRGIAIENALIAKNYDEATALAKEGIKISSKWPGLIADWYEWLLKISKAKGDTNKTIEYARWLFKSSRRLKLNCYNTMKETVPAGEWQQFVDDLIQELDEKSDFWYNKELITTICIEEMYWDRLFETVKADPTFENVHTHEKYLVAEYKPQIVALYEKAIYHYLERNVGRSYYQTACQYIQRIITLGDKETADQIIAKLQSEYSRRPALIQELGLIQH